MNPTEAAEQSAREIPIEEFDQLAREKAFGIGPFISRFGGGYGDYYCPKKTVLGCLKINGEWVKAIRTPRAR